MGIFIQEPKHDLYDGSKRVNSFYMKDHPFFLLRVINLVNILEFMHHKDFIKSIELQL